MTYCRQHTFGTGQAHVKHARLCNSAAGAVFFPRGAGEYAHPRFRGAAYHLAGQESPRRRRRRGWEVRAGVPLTQSRRNDMGRAEEEGLVTGGCCGHVT